MLAEHQNLALGSFASTHLGSQLRSDHETWPNCLAEIIGHLEVDFVASKEGGKLRLWAVDLNTCPTASLSGFQLFDFLAAGQFDPATGTYWVPGMPEMLDLDAPMLPNQAALQHSEATVSSCTLASKQDEPETAMQPNDDSRQEAALSSDVQSRSQAATGTAAADFENSGAAHEISDRHLYEQSAGRNSSYEHRQQNSTADQGKHCAPESDVSADAAALQDTRDPALSAASRRPLTRSSEEAPDADSREAAHAAAAHPAARQDNSQDQGTSGSADAFDDSQSQEQRQAQPSGLEDAAAWPQSEAAIMQQEVQLEPRFYAAIDLLVHGGMHKRQSAQFLQNCRLAGLGFDMMARQGLVLNFMDSMSSCCLGVQCAGPSPQLALQGLYKVMCPVLLLPDLCFCQN